MGYFDTASPENHQMRSGFFPSAFGFCGSSFRIGFSGYIWYGTISRSAAAPPQLRWRSHLTERGLSNEATSSMAMSGCQGLLGLWPAQFTSIVGTYAIHVRPIWIGQSVECSSLLFFLLMLTAYFCKLLFRWVRNLQYRICIRLILCFGPKFFTWSNDAQSDCWLGIY